MKAEMSVAGGLRQHRRELHVLVDTGENRVVSRKKKKRTGSTAALTSLDKKWKPMQKI